MKYLLALVALFVLAVPISTKTAVADDSYQTYELQATYNTQQQELQWSNQLVAYASTLQGRRMGQCVLALRNYFGIPKSVVSGAAKTTKINSTQAKVGSVIVLAMSRYGHVGIVIATNGDTITYFDSNGDYRQRGAIRTINARDKRIRGYRIL